MSIATGTFQRSASAASILGGERLLRSKPARRKTDGKPLTMDESEKLVRLARVVERATQVFDDKTLAMDWLKSTNAVLGGATPFSLLDTELGADSVFDTLGRLEQGVSA